MKKLQIIQLTLLRSSKALFLVKKTATWKNQEFRLKLEPKILSVKYLIN